MKRFRLIAGTLILALMTMGAGYAAWNDSLAINNTVQAGDLRIEFVQEDLHPYIVHFDSLTGEADAVETNLQHDPKVTVVEINNLYPGSTAMFETRIKNLGSVPAISTGAEVNFIGPVSDTAKNNIIVRGMLVHWRPTATGAEIVQAEGIPVDTGVPLGELEAQLSAMATAMGPLNPEEFLTFDVTDDYANQLAQLDDFAGYDPTGNHSLFFTLPASANNDTQNLSTNFQIKFNYKQFNS